MSQTGEMLEETVAIICDGSKSLKKYPVSSHCVTSSISVKSSQTFDMMLE